MLPCQRHLFDLPEDIAYLNCAYMSPLMKQVAEAGVAGIRRKVRPWETRPVDFFDQSEEARALFARLVNADADGIALIPAASYGLAVAARNLPIHAGQRVVTLAEQFPSNVYCWQEAARRAGGEVVAVRRGGNGDLTAPLLAAIDERTALAALPHCLWTDGALIDLARVRERLDEVGAALVVDGTQSVGALPFDVQRIRPDFLVVAAYKWLLSPYSIGFMYAAPERRQGEPLEHNWIGRLGSEDFARLVDYQADFQPGARRFDVGERANFILMPMAMAALRQILDWGVEAIQATLAARTRQIAGQAAALGLLAGPEALRAGHFLGLRFPAGPPAGLADRLAARQVHVSLRGDSVRITPHLYNNDTDVERLLSALAAAL
ncbi:MAG: aminotransferase class V-fold PLP-dependent enzyme [Alphaproteobacteria bacterium]|nr:aminotransferase class V-fold PLP-dependent enzyme [Alphaproteobacteria bacterium]